MSNKKILNQWKTFFENRGLSDSIKVHYLNYIKILLNNDVPIIFDFEHLSLLLGRQKFYLASVINCPERHYRTFKIKKRSGGYRKITSPYPALMEIQYWIYENILKKIPIKPCAHGFARNKSILTNSKIHVGQNTLLKLDLKDFFPSIGINRIISIFKSKGYPNIIAFYLSSICCYEDSLPQGTPTSPYLSNIVARGLDDRLIALAKRFEFRYTRYADDLTFSGERIPSIFIQYIHDIVESEGFEVNTKKTRLYRENKKKIVTGISVSGNTIKLPRKYKRELKQELHYILKFGLESHMKKKKIRKANYLKSLIGKLNFWLSIEPENSYAINAKKEILTLLNVN